MNRSRAFKLLLLALALSLSAVPSASASAEQSAVCHTVAQSVTERKNISCKQARKVATRAGQALKGFPECPGDDIRIWNGWRLTPDPAGVAIGTRFKKGDRSFHLTGGGAC
ncbi:MAG TPA: hypothetical protein VGB57_07400 [Allosphingosinicella sp.]|jgi:hypothetical protein